MKEFGSWVAFGLALLAVVAGILFVILWGTDKMNEPYVESCRAAGGVPVSTGRGSYNCASTDGGWIDVE